MSLQKEPCNRADLYEVLKDYDKKAYSYFNKKELKINTFDLKKYIYRNKER